MDNLPPPVKITQGDIGDSKKSGDEPLFEAKINNPFAKFFNWIKEFIKKQSTITIKIPLIGILITLSSFGIGLGSGYSWGVNTALSKFFPDSSPLLHRAISVEGIISKSSFNKYYLNSDGNVWTLKSTNPAVNLEDYLNKQVQVKGNLTKEKSVIEVSEIIPLEALPIPTPTPKVSPDSFEVSPPDPGLPELFPSLDWQTTQKRTLIFTSGKRKIEQDGVYLESALVSTFPQDFINYYLAALKEGNFKETLNSINPEGVTITYAQDNLFLTFGIKNKYTGSGDKRKLTGYSAFIEHN